MSAIIDRILQQVEDPALLDKLLSLSNADLNSLLLALWEEKARRTTPAQVLKASQQNRFVNPGTADAAAYHALEAHLLTRAQADGMETLLLSPSAPFASCSAFGCVDQNNVLTALRGTETLADPTNLMALHVADRIRRDPTALPLHFAATARVVRGQPALRKATFAHFGLFGLLSCGKAESSYACEMALLIRHLSFFLRLIREEYHAAPAITLRRRSGYPDDVGFFQRTAQAVRSAFPGVPVTLDESSVDNGYYKGVNYKLYILRDGQPLEIADGGFVDWLTQMTGSKKERCLISGAGLERLLMLNQCILKDR